MAVRASGSSIGDEGLASEGEANFVSSGATKIELLAHVTQVGGIDPFNDTFVSIHSYFTSIQELFNDLVEILRNSKDPRRDIAYINLLKKWLKNNSHLLTDSAHAQLVRNLIDSLNQLPHIKKFTTHVASSLERYASRSSTSDSDNWFERQFISPQSGGPEGFGSESIINLYTPEVIAQQLTLIDHQFLRRITASDLLHKAHTKPASSPNLQAFIRRFNDTAFWAVTEILKTIQSKSRTAMICKFIELASLLRNYKNFSSCLAILSGLRCTPIARLKQTWKNIPKDMRAQFDDLTGLASPSDNYSYYRKSLQAAQPPLIPYLGCMTKDFTAIDELPTFISGERVNWKKMKEMGTILNLLRAAQDTVFLFTVSESITSSLALIIRSNMNEEKQYKISHALEPPSGSSSSQLPGIGSAIVFHILTLYCSFRVKDEDRRVKEAEPFKIDTPVSSEAYLIAFLIPRTGENLNAALN